MNPDFEQELKEEQSLFKDSEKQFEKFDDPSLQDFIKPDKIEEEEKKDRQGADQDEKGSVAKKAVLDIVKNQFKKRQRVSAPTWNLLTSMVNLLIFRISEQAIKEAEKNNNKMIDSQHITRALEELKLDRLLDKMVEGEEEVDPNTEEKQEHFRGGDTSLLKFRNSEGGQKRARNMKLEKKLKDDPKNKRKQQKKAWKQSENEEELRKQQKLLLSRAKSTDYLAGNYSMAQDEQAQPALGTRFSMVEMLQQKPEEGDQMNFDQ